LSGSRHERQAGPKVGNRIARRATVVILSPLELTGPLLCGSCRRRSCGRSRPVPHCGGTGSKSPRPCGWRG
jgi:hypothetical protein